MKRVLLGSAAIILAAGAATADDVRVLMKPDSIPTVRVTTFPAAMGFEPVLPAWDEDSGMFSQEELVPGLDPEVVVHLWDPAQRVLISAPAAPAATGAVPAQRPAVDARVTDHNGSTGGSLLAMDLLDGTHAPLPARGVPAGWSGASLWSGGAEPVADAPPADVLAVSVAPDAPIAQSTAATDRTLLADQLRGSAAARAEPTPTLVRRDPIVRPEPFRSGPAVGGLDGDGVLGNSGWENPAVGAGLRVQR